MRIIDADALKRAIIKHICVKSEGHLLPAEKSIYDLVDKQPSVDLPKEQQPKHGHWIIVEYEYLDCSCCGESYYTGCDSTEDAKHMLKTGDVYKFCPYCGARMDGEKE